MGKVLAGFVGEFHRDRLYVFCWFSLRLLLEEGLHLRAELL